MTDQSAFRTVTSTFSASPQISVADVEAAKAEGFTLIINNRPDGEEDSAPQSADIMCAAANARKSSRVPATGCTASSWRKRSRYSACLYAIIVPTSRSVRFARRTATT